MSSPETDIPHLLTTEQVARIANCTTRTLERWRESGDGPTFVVIGRSIRYPVDELVEWIAHRIQLSATSVPPVPPATPTTPVPFGMMRPSTLSTETDQHDNACA